jgi:hypothetical protein
MVNYIPAAGMLAALSYEFDGEEVLFGLTTELDIESNGTHMLFPYSTGGNSISTFSAINPRSPGAINYQGVLLGDTDLLRRKVFAELGVMESVVRVKLLIPVSLDVLAHWEMYDFRMRAIRFSSQVVGNSIMVRGGIGVTFRSFTALPF